MGEKVSKVGEGFFRDASIVEIPLFWAIFIFWSYLAALSLFLPRANFPNVASVKTEFSTANYRAL